MLRPSKSKKTPFLTPNPHFFNMQHHVLTLSLGAKLDLMGMWRVLASSLNPFGRQGPKYGIFCLPDVVTSFFGCMTPYFEPWNRCTMLWSISEPNGGVQKKSSLGAIAVFLSLTTSANPYFFYVLNQHYICYVILFPILVHITVFFK